VALYRPSLERRQIVLPRESVYKTPSAK